MRIRAAIFDVYGTILEAVPSPADAAERWEFLWEDKLADPARLSLEEFAAGCERIVLREHAAARAVGVPHPEIYWPAVAKQVLPELTHLNETEFDEFLYQHAQLLRAVRLREEAAEMLRELDGSQLLLGIASNAQPYTLRELESAFSAVGLSLACFTAELCFWSYQFGFSKPDPHVFRLLGARLRARGIAPDEILMVGDRMDRDIEPALLHGWQTWQLKEPPEDANSGGWNALAERLRPTAGRNPS